MITRTLSEISTMVKGSGLSESLADLKIQGVSIDSRSIVLGNLFIPLVGEKVDGHNYVKETLMNGATAVLWQSDHPNPPVDVPLIIVEDTLIALQEMARAYRAQLSVKVIGITGSNGKTTTKDLLASILSTTFKVHKTTGNFNTHIGLPLTILQIAEDTELAVLEMGMRARGEIEFLSELAQPEAVIITNIGESHLLHLGTRQEIARAKLEIVKGLEQDGLLVYNGDEPLLQTEISTMKLPESMMCFRFGAAEDNEYFPQEVMLDQTRKGTLFKINTIHSPRYFIPFFGYHNVLNSLAAIAVAKYMGVEEQDIVLGLKNTKATSMRIEVIQGRSGITILNDAYNASPTSMRAAIELLEDFNGFARKIVVLGDMRELGPEEQRFHQEIGLLLKPEWVSYIFTYGPLAQYIASAAEPYFPEGAIKSFLDKSELLRHLATTVSPQDLILVKGSRGMKLEEIVNVLKDL